MGTLKIDTDDKLLELFKKKSMEIYGYKKGALKTATENLIKKWLLKKSVNWEELNSILKTSKSSVELQHLVWKGAD